MFRFINRISLNTIIKLLIPMIAAGLILALLFSGHSIIQAEEDTSSVKYYTSVQIQPGDSLWSIAKNYADGHYSNIPEYIKELKQINNLTSDTIHAYEYLVVAYYTEP